MDVPESGGFRRKDGTTRSELDTVNHHIPLVTCCSSINSEVCELNHSLRNPSSPPKVHHSGRHRSPSRVGINYTPMHVAIVIRRRKRGVNVLILPPITGYCRKPRQIVRRVVVKVLQAVSTPSCSSSCPLQGQSVQPVPDHLGRKLEAAPVAIAACVGRALRVCLSAALLRKQRVDRRAGAALGGRVGACASGCRGGEAHRRFASGPVSRIVLLGGPRLMLIDAVLALEVF